MADTCSVEEVVEAIFNHENLDSTDDNSDDGVHDGIADKNEQKIAEWVQGLDFPVGCNKELFLKNAKVMLLPLFTVCQERQNIRDHHMSDILLSSNVPLLF